MLRLMLALLLLHPSVALAARWAVVVGVGDYEDPALPDVAHARADAEAIRDWLTTVGGVPAANLQLLLDEGAPSVVEADAGQPVRASRANLLDVVARWLPERAAADDTVFFYFAGQGMVDAQGAPVLLPRDARRALPADTGLLAARLRAELPGTPVVWLDTSFGGRGEALPPPSPDVRPDLERLAGPGLTWLASGTLDAPAQEARGQPQGAFTDALLDALRTSDGRLEATWVLLAQALRGYPPPFAATRLPPEFPLADTSAVTAIPRVVPQAGHGDAVQALAWHPSRSWLASADATGIVQVIDVDAEEIRTRLVSGRRGVLGLAFDATGDLLFAVGRDAVVRAWDPADGTLVWEHALSAFDELTRVAPLGDRVAVGTAKGKVVVLAAQTGEHLATWRIGAGTGQFGPTVTRGLAWRPDGRAVASAAANGELSRWGLLGPEGRASKLVHQERLREHGPALHDVVWAGEHLLTGSADGLVEVWPASGEPRPGAGPLAVLPSNGFAVQHLALRPGAPEIAVVADDVRLWAFEAEGPPRSLPTPVRTTAVTWTADGTRRVTGHADGQLKLWDAERGEIVGRLPGQPLAVEGLAVADEAGLLAVVGDGGAHLWSLTEGRLAHRLTGFDGAITAARFLGGEDGALVTGGADGTLRWWSADEGEELGRIGTRAAVQALHVDGDRLFAASGEDVLVVGPDRAIRHRWSATAPVDDLTVCDPTAGVVVLTDGRASVRGVADGRRTSPRRKASVLGCPPDRERLHVGRGGGPVLAFTPDRLKLRPKEAMGVKGLLRDPAGFLLSRARPSELAFHPSEPWLVAGAEGTATRVFDLEANKVRLVLDTYGARTVAFHAPGRLVLTGSTDGTVQLWDDETGAKLATLVALGEEWLVWTPDGLFDGSPEGQRTLFRWRIGETLHAPSKFQRGYYAPGLLAQLARGERPRAVRDIASLSPPPRVSILSPDPGAVLTEGRVTVRVRVEDQGGGIFEPRLYLNGHRIAGTRGLEALEDAPRDDDVRFSVELTEGSNFLRATAFNGDGSWESLGDEITVTWEAPVTVPPKLHVLAVGIDQYRNRRLDLDFARDDAEAVADFFDEGLFGEVRTHVLVDDQATLANVREALARVAEEAAPRDALLLYFAGHGVLGGEVFYFLPWDVSVGDDEALAASGLSQTELGDALAKIRATKQLVVLDACHSGAAAASTLAASLSRRSTPGLIRAQSRLADSTGAFLIAASTDQQVAHEIPELGHGVLTYAILEAVGADGPPAANLDRDGNVTVVGLIQYVSETVPRLTDTYHRQRQEVVQSASGQDFPLVAP